MYLIDSLCPSQDTERLETHSAALDEAASFNSFNFWRPLLPEVHSLEEIHQEPEEAELGHVEVMAYSDESAAPSDDESGEYSDFSFWKTPLKILDLD